MMDSTIMGPEAIQDFLQRHEELLAQHNWLWRRTLRGMSRRAKTAEDLRLQLIELVDEEKRPELHPAIRAKALCLLLAPSLEWFKGGPVHAKLVNNRQPLTGWLSDIANINWQAVPLKIRLMAQELILTSWDLIPRRTDTVSREAYSRHLLEYAATTLLGQECEEMVNMYPLDCLEHTYSIFLRNRCVSADDKFRIDKLTHKRIGEDQEKIREYFLIVMDTLKHMQHVYPKPLLAKQMVFLLKHKMAIAKLFDLKMVDLLLFHLSTEKNLCLSLVATFVETNLEGQSNSFQVSGLADLETLKAMKRIAGSKYHRLAQQIGNVVRTAEKTLTTPNQAPTQPSMPAA